MKRWIQYTALILTLSMGMGMTTSQVEASKQINDSAALADLKLAQGVFLIDIADAKK